MFSFITDDISHYNIGKPAFRWTENNGPLSGSGDRILVVDIIPHKSKLKQRLFKVFYEKIGIAES